MQPTSTRLRFPGNVSTADGARAVVWVEAHITQAACVYPIAPSAAMSDAFASEYARGGRNLWNDPLEFIAADSDHSAASICQGFALAGGRATTFTSGSGLLLMNEVLRAAAGQRLPLVFHLATRAVASQGRTLHSGHDDLSVAAASGWGVLVARNPQEAADLALIARRTAEAAETPFLCAQDGYLTSHTVETVRLPEPEFMRCYVGAPGERNRAVVDPAHPVVSGPVQGPDSYMAGRIAQRFFYDRVDAALAAAMEDFYLQTGRPYGALRRYAMDDAEYALVGMGSMMETAEATVDYLRRSGIRAGAVSVLAYRPFPSRALVEALRGCSAVTILERTDEPLAAANPLTTEVQAALAAERVLTPPVIYSGVCGVGGREIRSGHVVAAVNNMLREGKRSFVLGIKHPDALEVVTDPDVRPAGSLTVRAHTVGGIGAAAANEVLASVASELFGLHVQAHGGYGIEKRGLPATCHLTVATEPVRIHGYTSAAEFVVIADPQAFDHGDPVEGLAEEGILYVEGGLSPEELWSRIPPPARAAIRRKHIRVCALDAARLAAECRSGCADRELHLRAMAVLGVFLRLTKFRQLADLSEGELFDCIGDVLRERWVGDGETCVAGALEIIRRAYAELRLLPLPAAAEATPASRERRPYANGSEHSPLVPNGFTDWVVSSYLQGREAELSADVSAARALVPPGTASARSFRGVMPALPVFDVSRCTGCEECVSYCPDAAIHTRAVGETALAAALGEMPGAVRHTLRAGFGRVEHHPGAWFGLAVDPDKCKGCGECVQICGTRQALRMQPKHAASLDSYEAGLELLSALTPETATRECLGSGADSCLGCGEAAAVRLALARTARDCGREQLAVVAAPGCPSEFSTAYPFNPYTVAVTNSLADNAAAEAIGLRLRWNQSGLPERRLWVIGGYAAMHESGLRALSRLLTSGLDINVLALDTQVWSASGGLTLTDTFASRPAPWLNSEPARFERRKELGQIAMMHPGVYVAQTTAAYLDHFLSAVDAANSFPGPALVIAYAACAREHGIGGGQAVAHERMAVESRAFPLFTYDPRRGETIRECLDLDGNPDPSAGWLIRPGGTEPFDFLAFARTEPRFAPHFSRSGEPGEYLLHAQSDRLANWRRLQELAGLRR